MNCCKAARRMAAKNDRDLVARWAVVRLAAMEADPRYARDHDLIALLRAQTVVLLAPGPVDVAALDELGAGEDLDTLHDAARRWLAAGAPMGDPWAGRRTWTPEEMAAAERRQEKADDAAKVAGTFYFPAPADDIDAALAEVHARVSHAAADLDEVRARMGADE